MDDTKHKKAKGRVPVLILFILSLLASAFSIYNLILLRNMNDLVMYFYIAIGIIVFLDLIFFFKTKYRFKKKRKKEKKNKGLITAMIFFILINLGAGLAIAYAYGFVGGINKKFVTYSSSLVVMKDNKAKNVSDIKNYKIGILNKKNSAEGYIIPKLMISENNLNKNNKFKNYDNYSSMVADLYSGDLDAIFISSSYVTMFASVSGYEHIKTDTKVIIKKSKKLAKTATSTKETASANKSISEPFTILLMGIDSTDETLSKNAVANGDSLILVTFNPKTLNATMITIPRDSYVPIACWSNKAENKITHAAGYGTDCMMQTIENYFDISINYYAKVNFKGLVKLVDAVGGIDAEVPKELCTDNSSRSGQVCIKAGMQHLDGEGALVLARNRKQLSGGDLDRGQNQQVVIKALINKLKEINDVSKFTEILNTVSANLDTNLTTQQIISFYNIGRDIMNRSLAVDDGDIVDIQQLYLQGSGQMIYDENMRMVLWDYIPNVDSKKEIIQAMKENLGLASHKTIKEFSFSINEPYEKAIIGYGPYKTNNNYDLLPDFTGDSKASAQAWANSHNLRVTFTGGDGHVIAQSYPAHKRIDKISGSVTLTLGGTKKVATTPTVTEEPSNTPTPTPTTPVSTTTP